MGSLTADGHGRRAREAVLHFAVAALSSLLLLALAGLVVAEVQPGWLAGLRNAVPAPLAGAPSNAPRGTSAPAPKPLPGASPGGPVLTSIEPATGSPGETVTVSGTNLFSANGTILVTFGGRVAPTRCPSERRCLVTVPAGPRATGTTTVRLRTSRGLSNALVFRYR